MHPNWSLLTYEPLRRTQPERHATYTANLVTLAALVAPGPLDVGHLLGADDAEDAWRRLAMLWRSHLPGEDWVSLWASYRVEWLPADDSPGARLTVRPHDGSDFSLYRSLPLWPGELDGLDPAPDEGAAAFPDLVLADDATHVSALREMAFWQAPDEVRWLIHQLIPVLRVGQDLNWYVTRRASAVAITRLLLDLLFELPSEQNHDRRVEALAQLSDSTWPPLREVVLEQLRRAAPTLSAAELRTLVAEGAPVATNRENVLLMLTVVAEAVDDADRLIELLHGLQLMEGATYQEHAAAILVNRITELGGRLDGLPD